MSEQPITNANTKIAVLIQEALILADEAGMSLVAIHLDEALQVLPAPLASQ